MHAVAREHVFGNEPAETGLIDFADERSHGLVIARLAVTVQADRSPSRSGGWKVRAPTRVLRFGRLNLTFAYKNRRSTACRFEELSVLPRRLSRREGVELNRFAVGQRLQAGNLAVAGFPRLGASLFSVLPFIPLAITPRRSAGPLLAWHGHHEGGGLTSVSPLLHPERTLP